VALLQQVMNEGGTDVAGSAEDGDFLGHSSKKMSRAVLRGSSAKVNA